MSKNKSERTVAPVTLETDNERVDRARIIYNEVGIYAVGKNKQEVLFEINWEDVKVLKLYKNKTTLGIVHFLLVLPCLYLGIIPALFLPQVIMHALQDYSKGWSGYGEVINSKNEVIKFTPLGWFRVGFHMGEPKTIQKFANEFSDKARVEIFKS